jgi:uncharacterized protein YjiS (DUF1127 family)
MVASNSTTSINCASQASPNCSGIRTRPSDSTPLVSDFLAVVAPTSDVPMVIGAEALSPVIGLLRAVIGIMVGAHRRATARRQLGDMDHRLLRDIGLHRDQLPSVVRERVQNAVMLFHR